MEKIYDWEHPVSPIGDPDAMRKQLEWVRDQIQSGNRSATLTGTDRLLELLHRHFDAVERMAFEIKAEQKAYEQPPIPEDATGAENLVAVRSGLKLFVERCVKPRSKAVALAYPAVEKVLQDPEAFPDWLLDQLGGGAIYVEH